MLKIELTENCIGVSVSGDYEELFFLREAIGNLIGDRTSYEGYAEVNAILQKFVFELLHAYRAERDSFKTNCDTPCYKFNMLLPEIIFIADAINDYMVLSEGDNAYVDRMAENSLVAEKINERHYIDKAFIRFFQASVWNAVKELIGDKEFDNILSYRDYETICKNKELRYKDFCGDWVDILNIRYINGESEESVIDIIKKLAKRDDEYISKERAMKEHSKDGNISLFMELLNELQYPDEWEW